MVTIAKKVMNVCILIEVKQVLRGRRYAVYWYYILRELIGFLIKTKEICETETIAEGRFDPLWYQCCSRRRNIESMKGWTSKGNKIMRQVLVRRVLKAKFVNNRVKRRWYVLFVVR